jgi:hypothetical protein
VIVEAFRELRFRADSQLVLFYALPGAHVEAPYRVGRWPAGRSPMHPPARDARATFSASRKFTDARSNRAQRAGVESSRTASTAALYAGAALRLQGDHTKNNNQFRADVTAHSTSARTSSPAAFAAVLALGRIFVLGSTPSRGSRPAPTCTGTSSKFTSSILEKTLGDLTATLENLLTQKVA